MAPARLTAPQYTTDQIMEGTKLAATAVKGSLKSTGHEMSELAGEHLRESRYTNLWKHLNDVRTILGHNGFSSDETRQMVVAHDNYTGNAYVKVCTSCYVLSNPVLDFNNLCIIYGHTTAVGRYSRSSHDMDFEDEVQGLKVGGAFGDAINAGVVDLHQERDIATLGMKDGKPYFIKLRVYALSLFWGYHSMTMVVLVSEVPWRVVCCHQHSTECRLQRGKAGMRECTRSVYGSHRLINKGDGRKIYWGTR
ncbi:unnamed protein product [Linum tenue]|uniref:Uncharacterized protein n=1 Tax=Linum tenue TaxID=586396 RepID=A0AAV0KNB3_9ROSI|nr:unnamed protein product [Linum tenue]